MGVIYARVPDELHGHILMLANGRRQTMAQVVAQLLQVGMDAESEGKLAIWATYDRSRDEIVRAAHDAGVTKLRIHEITGIARTTIDRILRRPA